MIVDKCWILSVGVVLPRPPVVRGQVHQDQEGGQSVPVLHTLPGGLMGRLVNGLIV